MALISQIKVGDTTYDVAMKAGNGIYITRTGVVSVKLGTGLFCDEDGSVYTLFSGVSSGLIITSGELNVRAISGLEASSEGLGIKVSTGLSTANGILGLKVDGAKLIFNSSGELTVA